MKVLYRERALADIEDIFLFLNERSPAGARNVLRAIHEAVGEIAEHPLAAPRTSDPRQDSWAVSLQDFYGVVVDEFVEIIHVRHAARRPWLGRVL